MAVIVDCAAKRKNAAGQLVKTVWKNYHSKDIKNNEVNIIELRENIKAMVIKKNIVKQGQEKKLKFTTKKTSCKKTYCTSTSEWTTTSK